MLSKVMGFAGAIDTVFGKTRVRTTQLGFPAELTSVYNATTGYDWKRLQLDLTVPGFNDPTIQPEGQYAFEVTGDTSLTVGTRVWLEPDPDCVGYDFQSPRLALASGQVAIGVLTRNPSDATWHDILDASITLPGAGTYLLWGRVNISLLLIPGDYWGSAYARIRLDNGTGSLDLSGVTILSVSGSIRGIRGGTTMLPYTASGADTIALQAFCSANLAYADCAMSGPSVGYVRIG